MNFNKSILDSFKTLSEIPFNILDNYLSYISKYKNLFLYSLPARIYVPDESNSIYDDTIDLTYNIEDKFFTGVRYKLYEYVPVYYSSPTMFNLMETQDKGVVFDTTLSISLIGFDDITIGALVQFYTNYLSQLVFEVINIRTPLLTNIKEPIIELDLKVSNITNPENSLNISDIYYFDYSEGKFVDKNTFELKKAALEYIEKEIIPYTKANCFDYNFEIYIPPDNLYMQLFYFDYIGRRINVSTRRLDLPIPIDPIINPDKYSQLGNYTSYTLDDYYNLLNCQNTDEQNICIKKTCELIQKLKEAGYD